MEAIEFPKISSLNFVDLKLLNCKKSKTIFRQTISSHEGFNRAVFIRLIFFFNNFRKAEGLVHLPHFLRICNKKSNIVFSFHFSIAKLADTDTEKVQRKLILSASFQKNNIQVISRVKIHFLLLKFDDTRIQGRRGI